MSVNWLTPETAIGARLPCGAVVLAAEPRRYGREGVLCTFDRAVLDGLDTLAFRLDGMCAHDEMDELRLIRSENVSSWEAAYGAWVWERGYGDADDRSAWRAAVDWCVSQVKAAPVDSEFSRQQILKRIMGDA